MTRTTIHDKLVASLQKRGFRIIPDASSRFTVLTKDLPPAEPVAGSLTPPRPWNWAWVGKAGALHVNVKKQHSSARKASDALKAKLIAELEA